MEHLLEKLWKRATRDATLPIEIQLFRVICLIVHVIFLFCILPLNLLQHLPLILNILVALFSLTSLYFYFSSRNGRHHIKSFYLLSVLMLNASWMPNGGSTGSIHFFFFIAALYPMIFFRSPSRWTMFLLLTANYALLMALEHHFPSMVVPFETEHDRVMDLLSGFLFCNLICVLLVWALFRFHRHELDERRRTEEELRSSQSLLHSLVEGTGDAIYVKDAAGRYLLFNSAASTLVGKSIDDVLGNDDTAIFEPEQAKKIMEQDRTVLATGKELVQEYEVQFSTGGKNIFTTKGPLFDTNGQTIGLYGISRDVTDLRTAERNVALEKKKYLEDLTAALELRVHETIAELRQKDQLLIQQSRMAAMGEMIGNIAHQWRQPLNNLGLLIQQLKIFQEMGELNETILNENIEKSMNLIHYMSKTISDFSDFFKADKPMAVFSVSEVVQNSIKLLDVSLSSRNIAIDLQKRSDPHVQGFENEYAQVVLVLIQNAKDAFFERRVAEPKMTITITEAGGRSLVTIRDNAGGIPEGILHKVFDPYFTTKHKSEGTGIGLFMSKTIIEKNMNGSLWVRNTAEGAEFGIEV